MRKKVSLKKLENIIEDIQSFNGLLAKWKSSGYSGNTPLDLVENINSINAHTEIYLRNFNGEKND